MSQSDYFSSFPERREFPVIIKDTETADQFSYRISFPDFFRSISVWMQEKTFARDQFLNVVTVLDGERPDQLSFRLYGTTAYYWTFFVINDHLRRGEFFQWPLSGAALSRQKTDLYSGTVLVAKNIDNESSPVAFIGRGLFNGVSVGDSIIGETSGASGIVSFIRRELGQLGVSNVSGNFMMDGEMIRVENGSGDDTSSVRIQYDSASRHIDAVYAFVDENGLSVNHPDFVETTDRPVGFISFSEFLDDKNRRLSAVKTFDETSVIEFSRRYKELMQKGRIENE